MRHDSRICEAWPDFVQIPDCRDVEPWSPQRLSGTFAARSVTWNCASWNATLVEGESSLVAHGHPLARLLGSDPHVAADEILGRNEIQMRSNAILETRDETQRTAFCALQKASCRAH